MSFSPSQFNTKLDSLSETQESIVSISQWVLFHQKHFQESAKIWSDYIQRPSLPPAKKLSLLYLCNDVVQQARRKGRSEFTTEFAKVLPGAISVSYSELKPKIDRLLSVWQERKIFTTEEIAAMKSAVETPIKREELAQELKFVNDLFMRLHSLTDISQGNLTQMGIQSKAYLNPQDPAEPSVNKLSTLEKLGRVCINNVEEIKRTRMQIKSQLENLANLMVDGANTDDTKIGVINDKLAKLKKARDELEEEEEEEQEDDMPAYEPDSDNESDSRKRRLSQTSSGASTPSKRVAFSEDIEVFEEEEKEEKSVDVFSLLSKLAE